MLDAEKSPLMFVFRRRVSKLLFALFLSCPLETRDCVIEPILDRILIIVSYSGDVQSNCKDTCAVKWLLGITYSVLCCKSPKYRGQVDLTEHGKRKVCYMSFRKLALWMSQPYQLPSGQISNKWTYFMMSLFEHWFILTPNELQFFTSDPEGCLSSGGISSISVGHDAKANSVYADLNSIWNVDNQASELCVCNIETIMGISDSSQHMLTPQPCRQLTELIFTIFCRLYEEADPVLYEIVQLVNPGTNKPYIFEAIMRFVQLCLPYFGTKANWITLAEQLIADGSVVGNSIQDRIGSQPIENEITSDVKECETQIYMLTLLGKLIHKIDLIAYPQFITPILNTLNHLWSIGKLNQLKLFIIWFTIYLDIQYSQQNFTSLSSSAIGLIFLAAKYCLIRAPEDAHSDVTPKATELRLELLSRLVLYHNM
ncbi:unnamed protein product [Schistosoma margrebowiei]|uniref:Uncharacterized protein n=1 Tax=Schistosoma margrebowiei TaxID=48269 RepID=A0A183LMZ9_9TREM|nr:unnamed protein product [Schistosoma margrebowiei]